ncbi:MAG: hypothetical protein ACREWG_03080 [Gammaproteobacteria bacterium]
MSGLGLLACSHVLYAWGIEPDDEPQQQEDRGRIDCVTDTERYAVHFTAYLDDASTGNAVFLPYCQDLPGIGRVYFTLDFLKREPRAVPVAVRILAEAGDNPASMATVLTVPPRTYPSGSIELETRLDTPGRYTVLLSLADGQAAGPTEIRIPLRVAAYSGYSPVLVGLAAALLPLAYWVYRRHGRAATPV